MALGNKIQQMREKGLGIIEKNPAIKEVIFDGANDGGIYVIKDKETQKPNIVAATPPPIKVISQSPVKSGGYGDTSAPMTTKKAVEILRTDASLLPKTQPLKRAEEILTNENPATKMLSFTRNPYLIAGAIFVILFLLIAIIKK